MKGIPAQERHPDERRRVHAHTDMATPWPGINNRGTAFLLKDYSRGTVTGQDRVASLQRGETRGEENLAAFA